MRKNYNFHQPIRAFFAIDLDTKTRDLVTKIINFLKTKSDSRWIRWVKPENLHITLRFLGNIKITQQSAIVSKIVKAVHGSPPFKIEIDSLGLFPSKSKPRVIAININYSSALENLLALVEKVAVESGFPPEERPARAHITIGRLKGKIVSDLGLDLTSAKTTMLVSEIVLYKSQLTRQGSVYTPLEKIGLGKK